MADFADLDELDIPELPDDLDLIDDPALPDPFDGPDDVHFGSGDIRSADELIIGADGTGYPSMSDFVSGTNPHDPVEG